MANDAIFTTRIDPQHIIDLNTPLSVNKPTIGRVHFDQGFISIHTEVWNDAIPQLVINQHSPSVQQTDRIVNIVASNISLANLTEYTRQFYDHFQDEYDFIHIIYPGFSQNRHHIDVNLDIQGIGKQQFDYSAEYGSSGRLMGINVFPNTIFYDGASTGYQHEIGHQWINFLSGTAFETAIPHWPLSDLANSIMGFSPGGGQGLEFPFNLVKQDDNNWLLQNQTQPPVFNDLELYLMGLVAEDDVSPHIVFDNQDQELIPGTMITGPVTTITIDDIIAVFGSRIPHIDDSPKQFRIATIIVTNSLLTDKRNVFLRLLYFTSRVN